MPHTPPLIQCWTINFKVPESLSALAAEWFEEAVIIDRGHGDLLLYLEEEPNYEAWQQRFIDIEAAFEIAPIPFEILPVEEENWVGQTQLKNFCIKAGRYRVYDLYMKYLPEDSTLICVDANLSFGAGDHPTTRGCLEALSYLAKTQHEVEQRMLDIGCGSGILSIAMAKTWSGIIIATDIKSTAIDATRHNAALNQLHDRIKCHEADGLHHPSLKQHAPYSLVCANLLTNILMTIAPGLSTLLAPQAMIILSGILTDQADGVLAAYEALNLKEFKRFVIEDWITLVMEKH